MFGLFKKTTEQKLRKKRQALAKITGEIDTIERVFRMAERSPLYLIDKRIALGAKCASLKEQIRNLENEATHDQ